MAFTSIPLFCQYPAYGSSGSTYVTVDADGEGMAGNVQVPITGTCTDIAFSLGLTTTGGDLSVRLETIDADTGLPSGTLIDSPTNAAYGTATAVDGSDNVILTASINSGTGVSVARGDHISIVVTRPTSGAYVGRINHNTQYISSVDSQFPLVCTQTGSWAKGSYSPIVAMKIGDVWYCPAGCQIYGAITSVSINDPGTPEQAGVRINQPVGLRIAGAVCFIAAGAAEDYQIKLYSTPTGTPNLLATSDNFDADYRQNVNGRWQILYFDSSVELSKDTDYALVVNPTTANDIQIYYHDMGANTYNATFPGGSYATYYYRADTGAFTETDTKKPFIIPLYDGIDIPAGGAASGVRNPFGGPI